MTATEIQAAFAWGMLTGLVAGWAMLGGVIVGLLSSKRKDDAP
jgi:hypothetical protein